MFLLGKKKKSIKMKLEKKILILIKMVFQIVKKNIRLNYYKRLQKLKNKGNDNQITY